MSPSTAASASPRVTVIIPTYNWSSVLPYSIGSVLRQSFADFELLVIGDGCTDDSGDLVAGISDPRVRWINLPVNEGHQSAPNNEGIRQARGEVVAYLGHDDLWLPHHLAVLVGALDAGAGLAHSMVHMIDADGSLLAPAGEAAGYQPGQWLPPTGVAHRRSAALAAGGWPDYRMLATEPESDLWRRMHEGGTIFQAVPRLTAVKFPAARRKDCYKIRACDEQRCWSERMLREPDLEAVEIGKLLVAAERRFRERLSLAGDLRAVLRRLPAGLGRRLRLGRHKPFGKGEMVDRRRAFKGLNRAADGE